MMFFKETAFQDFTMGKVPEEWRIENLQDLLIQLKNGLTLKQNKEQNGYPITRIETISHGVIDIERVGYAPAIKKEDAEEYRLLKGDLLFSHINSVEHVGKSALYKGTPEVLLHGMNLLLLRPNKEQITSDYLLYAIRFLKAKNLFAAIAKKAVNQASINQTELGKVKIPVPSLPEQRAIVGVLGVVDSAIEYANQIIGKTERLKRGLIQQLLTRGIGHTETKQTPIGNIPKEWGLDRIGNLVELRSNKSVNHFENVAFIPMELVPDQQIFAKYQIRAREDVKSSTYCEAGDLLLAKITPSLENGKQGIVPSDVPNGIALATTEVFPLKCTGINKFFLFYVLKHSQFRNQIIASMIGTTGRQRASKESVERLEIPVPPPNEQQRIAEIFFEVDKKLELETAEKQRLERIKRGLMDLLLTGKVRIRVD